MPAQRKDATARAAFAKCIIKHIDEWFAFARERNLGISREDIILVTGCHLTRTWATIALQEGEQVSFGVHVSGVSDVMWQFMREGAQELLTILDRVARCVSVYWQSRACDGTAPFFILIHAYSLILQLCNPITKVYGRLPQRFGWQAGSMGFTEVPRTSYTPGESYGGLGQHDTTVNLIS